MTTEHIHNYNDTCEVVYTCPLQRLQECVCGATRYVEIPDSGIPVIKLSDEEAKQYLQKKKIDAMTQIPESIAKQPLDPNVDCSKWGTVALDLVKKVFSEMEAKQKYIQEMTDLIAKNASALDLAKCLKKHFVNTPYFIDQLNRQQSDNNLMLSPLGNPNESELIEAREIEKILSEIKKD